MFITGSQIYDQHAGYNSRKSYSRVFSYIPLKYTEIATDIHNKH